MNYEMEMEMMQQALRMSLKTTSSRTISNLYVVFLGPKHYIQWLSSLEVMNVNMKTV